MPDFGAKSREQVHDCYKNKKSKLLKLYLFTFQDSLRMRRRIRVNFVFAGIWM